MLYRKLQNKLEALCFPFFKILRNTLLTECIMLNSSINCYCTRYKTNMLSYLIVTSNGLFWFKPFEEGGVQKCVFQDYLR